MIGPFLRWSGGLWLSLGSLQGSQTAFHLVIWTMSMHEDSAGKFGLLSNQGISGSIRLKHKKQGPSHIHIPKGKLLLRCLWKDFPSLRDEARFPCIVSRAIAFSQSNMLGASICLIELQRVPNNTVTRPEEHWCQPRNAKLLGVPKINLRWGQFPLHWLHHHPAIHNIQNKWLDSL